MYHIASMYILTFKSYIKTTNSKIMFAYKNLVSFFLISFLSSENTLKKIDSCVQNACKQKFGKFKKKKSCENTFFF